MIRKFDIANMVLDGVSRSINIKPDRCTRIKHKNSQCTLCHLNCAVDAIKVGTPGTTVKIDHEKCTGCGICVNVCPTQTFTLRNNGHKQFLDKCSKFILPDGTLNITCAERPLGASKVGATVECIGIINVVDILTLYLRGVSKFNIFYSNCIECVSKNGSNILEKEVRKLLILSTVFEDLNDLQYDIEDDHIKIVFPKQHDIIRIEAEEKPNPTVDRRGVFNFFKNNIKENAIKGASIIAVDEPEERTRISFEKFMPIRRKAFLDCIMRLGNLTASEVATGTLFNNIVIDKKCIYCGMCEKFCPTGSLKINEDKTEITFNPSECTSCMLCKPACYHGFLDYKSELELKDFFSDILLAKKELEETENEKI